MFNNTKLPPKADQPRAEKFAIVFSIIFFGVLFFAKDCWAVQLLFKSGFESDTALGSVYGNGPSSIYQTISGTDNSTGFTWPLMVFNPDPRTTGIHLIPPHSGSDPLANHFFNSIETVIGHTGVSTKALQMSIQGYSGCCPQAFLGSALMATSITSMYMRVWVKLPASILPQIQAHPGDFWRMLWEMKTSNDYRITTMIYSDSSGNPYWYTHADNKPNNTCPPNGVCQDFWSASSKTVPVPIDQWFLMEIYLKRSTRSDGRFFWAVNSNTIADKMGSNYGVNNESIIGMFYMNLYGNYFPMSWWIDDIEIWDAPPCQTLPCGSDTPSPDTTPPAVSLTAPSAGSTVSGTSVTISANASDNVGVVGVQFKLDGNNLGTEDTSAPYSITWNTTQTSNGSHTLTATARDAAANQTTSAGVSVTVSNATSDTQPPTIPTNLAASAVSSSQINLSWSVSSDNIGVTGYRIYRCAGSGCTATTQIATPATNSYSDTGLTANTTYVYRVSAYDLAGNVSVQSSSVSATIQSQSLGDITTGLVGYWKFDEVSGTTASDSSGNNNNGTLTNGPTWTTGKYGNALNFDGSDDYVDAGNGSSLNLSSSGTILMWLKPDDYGSGINYRHVLSKMNTYTDRNGYALLMNYANGYGGFGVDLGSASAANVVWSTGNPWTGWALIGATWDGTTIRVYKDGIQTNQGNQTLTPVSNVYNLYIGVGNNGSPAYYYDGLIDEVRIYNRALSASEIQTLYNGISTDTTPPSAPTGVTVQ